MFQYVMNTIFVYNVIQLPVRIRFIQERSRFLLRNILILSYRYCWTFFGTLTFVIWVITFTLWPTSTTMFYKLYDIVLLKCYKFAFVTSKYETRPQFKFIITKPTNLFQFRKVNRYFYNYYYYTKKRTR